MSEAGARDECRKKSASLGGETESQVYSATRDTLFSNQITQTGAHPLVSSCLLWKALFFIYLFI